MFNEIEERKDKLIDEFEELEKRQDAPEVKERIAEIKEEVNEIEMMIQTELF